MSENLKDLIDKAEEEEKNRALLEKTIEKLNNEINRLKIQLEGKNSQTTLTEKITIDSIRESDEINILKNLITSQRQELAQRDYEVETLQRKVEDLNLVLAKQKEMLEENVDPMILEEYNTKIENLTEDYNRLEKDVEPLKIKISELDNENNRLRNKIQEMKIELATIAQLEQDLIDAESKIADLEDENNKLKEKGVKIKESKTDIEFIESTRNTISNLMEEVNRLENVVKTLNEKNFELENENSLLRNNIDFLKIDKPDAELLEEEIAILQEQIIELEAENKTLRERKEKVEKEEVITALPQREIDIPVRVSPLISESNQVSEPPLESKELSPIESNNMLEIEEDRVTPSHTVFDEMKSVLSPESIKREQPILEGSPEGRRRCPKCGNANTTLIREMPDKTHIILSYPRMYGKKYMCGLCGTEWR
ncbi:MAG: hypothetical protein ACFFA6_10960 [Promethearchaeota archaeon]